MKNLRSLAVLLIAIPLSGLYGEDSAYTGSAQYTGIVKFYGNGSIIVIPPMANLVPADFHWTVDADTAVTGAVKQWDLVSIQGDYTPDKQPGHLKVLTLVQSSLGQRAVIDAPPDESGTLYVRNLQGKEAVWKVDESTVVLGPVAKGQFKTGDAVYAMVFPSGNLAVINVEKRDVAVKPHQKSLAELAESGTAQDVQAALDAGADAKAADPTGTPVLLLAAAANPDPAVVAELLKAGADANVEFKMGAGTITPLVAAAWQNKNPDVIGALVKGGADMAREGGEALVAAAGFNPNPEMILTLLKAGANAAYLDQSTGKSALYFAQQNPGLKGTEALKKLEAASAPPAGSPADPKIPEDFVLIPGGVFTMGSPADEPGRQDNEVQHRVSINSFYMESKVVTQAQWAKVMGNNHSNFKGDSLPEENISWNDAVEYCNKLSLSEGRAPAYAVKAGAATTRDKSANGYRLPTEAEWEYAARGGAPGTAYPYSGSARIDEVGWYSENSGQSTHPVGQKKPNALSLYDMTGNVFQWCSDYLDLDIYGKDVLDNPSGDEPSDVGRAMRGGCWFNDATYARVAYRGYGAPDDRESTFGFRVALPNPAAPTVAVKAAAADSAVSAVFDGVVSYDRDGVLTFSPTVKDAVPRNVKWSLDSATQLTGTVKLWDLVSVQGTYVASQKSGHLTVLTFKNRSTGRKGVVDGVQGDGSSLSVRTDKGEETWNLVQDTVVNGPVKRGKFAVGNQIFARVFPDNTLAEINVENVKAAPATTP